MRLPRTRSYRAFPELDAFSDAECRRFTRAAMRHHPVSTTLVHLLLAPAIVSIGVLLALVFWATSGATGLGGKPAHDLGAAGLVMGATVVVVGSIGLIWLALRDRWLRRILDDQLGGARCRACGYSLLGLPVMGNHIVCPECGRGFDLRETGLSQEDVLARPMSARCAACGGAMGGAPVVNNHMICPECGIWSHVRQTHRPPHSPARATDAPSDTPE